MNSLFLLFIGLPAVEIFLMIKIGGKIVVNNKNTFILFNFVFTWSGLCYYKLATRGTSFKTILITLRTI